MATQLSFLDLPSSQGDSLAHHFPMQGTEGAKMMTVSSGLKCLELYQKQGVIGSLQKMLLGCSHWESRNVFLTWKTKVTKQKHFYFQLVPLVPPISETESSLLPTPTASQYGSNQGGAMGRTGKKRFSLDSLAKNRALSQEMGIDPLKSMTYGIFPTPSTKISHGNKYQKNRHGKKYPTLAGITSEKLNPQFLEYMMGFPIGWTELKV